MDDPFLERLRRGLEPDFVVDGPLGEPSGMGIVVRARDVSLDCWVAIKTIKPELATAVAVERFLREARTLASFAHPNIVRINRYGTTPDGIPYFVMELVEGETLSQRLERGPLPPEEVVRIGRDILSALEAAHERGIIHRDIKPANIFLPPGRALLADFGIVKNLQSRGDVLTRRGESPATPLYAAPEQLAAAEVGPATDLWSLAAVLYEAVTGRAWSATNPIEDPVAGDWNGVPVRLRGTLLRGLAFAPADRWPDAASFRRAMELRGRGRPLQWAGVGAAVAGIVYLLSGIRPRPAPPRPAIPDLAITPFGTTSVGDRRLGIDVSRTLWQIIHDFDRVTVAPMGDTVAPHTEYVVRGSVVIEGDSMVVHVIMARGTPEQTVKQLSRAGPVGRRWEVAEQVALDIIRTLQPEADPPGVECAPASVGALEAWLDGEDAFARDDWEGAEGYFEKAMAQDPDFCMPVFRLALARRWSRKPMTDSLRHELIRHRDRLPRADRLLLDAELEPDPGERRRIYERAVDADPFSGYAALQFGSELFHRGALDGIPLDSAVALLREAIVRHPSLSPARDQLVWTLVRLGRRAAADSALEALVQNVPDPSARFVSDTVFRVLYLARFEPESAARAVGGRAGAEMLEWVRLGLSFDLARMQAFVGDQLTSFDDAQLRARGHVARGLARLVQGQPLGGIADLDTAGALVPAFALQAAQWRVLTPHLGIPGVPDSVVQSGIRRLDVLGPSVAPGRSAWTRGIAAALAGDMAELSRQMKRVPPADSALRDLLRGLQAARSSPANALDVTERLRGAAEERNLLGDPFARALLHLLRAGWFDAVGDTAAAVRERRWHENADFEGWLDSEIQSAEVDWVAGAYVRVREGMRRIDGGDLSACADLRRVVDTLWIDVEPGVDALRRAGQAKAQVCP